MIDRGRPPGADGSPADVIDYKTGSVRPFRADRDDPVGRGRHLQLPVYAMAAKAAFDGADVHARYRFIGDEPG